MAGLSDSIRYFFETKALNPHGICLLWRPELIWTHAISDLLIGLAYFSIPLVLGVFLYNRRDVRFSWAVWMFVAFILLCGVTHFMMILTLWVPVYGIEALIKGATAVVSVVTAVALWPLLPKAIALPSTHELQTSLAERDAALIELRTAMATMVEMREHEARQKLLLDELNHRVKNTLASVQSVAAQTLNESKGMDEARNLFLERLMALSATHNLLVKREWESASLHELIDAALRHYGRPYAYSGPDVKLEANLAVSLGMALHELATNALKHGAWSGDGRIDIALSQTNGSLDFIWHESGGPIVQPPGKRGFGSRLLERGIAAELAGQVTLDFATGGLICMIHAPLSARLQVVQAA
ncbi:MAG: sensor histidine kinase [Alphaproteobacteria bacterium]|nr:sensor histidine kinase [Alphaproteobacteria bacterium]MBU1514595.1 sensor histidine kinase [Alphaproteobacteria bacterium]MBU2096773.1 sensor histidine kinase [Alphaproteobacteria bacterium]MBU2150405.1 sensor histidine kinase [Alphaproteobacteria bacterium]MBU2306594.1 sensor histidine kinase [Alphaproteobacteria bacterium]